MKKTPLKRKKPINKRSKNKKSQVNVFEYIWRTRKHVCQVCKKEIKEARPINFSHLLPKGSYKRYIDNPENILIKCEDCHNLWGTERAKNLQHVEMWKWVCDLYYKLMYEYFSNGK